MAHPQTAAKIKLADLGLADVALDGEVRRLFGVALGRTVTASENPSRESETAWDSFTHVELVFLLEDHFKLRFKAQEIAGLQDLRQVVRLLEARLAP